MGKSAMYTILATTLLAALPAGAATPADASADALIKSVPALSAGPFSLGMPRDAAVAKLKAEGLLNHQYAQPEIGFNFRSLPNQTFFGGSYGTTGPGPQGWQSVFLMYTTFPTQPVVTGIVRALAYGVSSAPNLANTVAALKAKYGDAPVTPEANTLVWLFDRSGHPLPVGAAKKLMQLACLDGSTSGFIGAPSNAARLTADTPVFRQDVLGRKIARGYVATGGGVENATDGGDNRRAPCAEVVYVSATVGVREPGRAADFGEPVSVQTAADWSRMGNDLVQGVQVYILDAPLDHAASVASREAVLGSGAQHQQQQMKGASKNKPSL